MGNTLGGLLSLGLAGALFMLSVSEQPQDSEYWWE